MSQPLTRRALLSRGATAAGAFAASATLGRGLLAEIASAAPDAKSRALRPADPAAAILAAAHRHDLVAVTERHMLQEWHDFIATLITKPEFSERFDDIVVEFGNAAYQQLVDRFVAGKEVANGDLRQVWRQIGDPTWNAPVYEQFFRLVRGVNRSLPARRQLRILLGQPPITMNNVLARPHDRSLVAAYAAPLDSHFAAVVRRQVLARGRRALLVAGKGHLLRGVSNDSKGQHPNAASRLAAQRPFVVDNLVLPPGANDAAATRIAAELGGGSRPRLALLAGSWLGQERKALAGGWVNEMAYRARSVGAARYGAQADAVLYFGPGATLTASRPDASIYHCGSYAQDLRRLGPVVGPYLGSAPVDLVAAGLAAAVAGPSWFA